MYTPKQYNKCKISKMEKNIQWLNNDILYLTFKCRWLEGYCNQLSNDIDKLEELANAQKVYAASILFTQDSGFYGGID